jgi:hypothetical protein
MYEQLQARSSSSRLSTLHLSGLPLRNQISRFAYRARTLGADADLGWEYMEYGIRAPLNLVRLGLRIGLHISARHVFRLPKLRRIFVLTLSSAATLRPREPPSSLPATATPPSADDPPKFSESEIRMRDMVCFATWAQDASALSETVRRASKRWMILYRSYFWTELIVYARIVSGRPAYLPRLSRRPRTGDNAPLRTFRLYELYTRVVYQRLKLCRVYSNSIVELGSQTVVCPRWIGAGGEWDRRGR